MRGPRRKVVIHRSAKPICAGSIPAVASRFVQERQRLDTNRSPFMGFHTRPGGEIGKHARLKIL